MKKIAFLFLFLSLFFVFCACKKQELTALEQIKARGKIVVGIKTDSKPFGFVNDNMQIDGFDADIARQIAKYLLGNDRSIEFVPVTAQNRITKLNAGEVDMLIATMSVNERRMQVVSFSKPYFMAGQAILVKNTSEIQTLKDLNDKNVGIILGTTSEKTMRELAPKAILSGFKLYGEAFDSLQKGDIDAILADDSILYGIVADNADYKILPKRYTKEYYAVAVRNSEQSNSLKEKLDYIIEDINSNGKLEQIKRNRIPRTSF